MTVLRALAGTALVALIAGAVLLGGAIHEQNIEDGHRIRDAYRKPTSIGTPL